MKRIVTGLGIMGVLLAIWGAAGLAQDKPLKKVVFAVTTKDISVGHSAHSSLPQALGYWKEEGLDVTVTSVEGSVAGMQQLAAGNLQIVSLGPEEIVIGREKGVKIKGFYVQARETIYRIVVAADSPLQKLADLKGKTIGVPALASGSVPFAKALVASVGLDPEKDVKILAVGVGAPGRLALQQRLRPEDGRLLRIGHGARLHEALTRVGVHDGSWVQKRRRDRRMLHHVVNASKCVLVGDLLPHREHSRFLRHPNGAPH